MPISKKKLYVANWKENKSFTQGLEDFTTLLKLLEGFPLIEKEVVICPSYPLLSPFKEELERRDLAGVYLGAQNVSRFETGSHTGEVSALVLRELVDYVIVGHSERRRYLGESATVVNDKIFLCRKFGMIPIVCVGSEEEASLLAGVSLEGSFLAFESPESIGGGKAQTLEKVKDFCRMAHAELGSSFGFLYGGSVDGDDVTTYLSDPEIDGVVIGGESLDPSVFFKILSKT